MTFNDLAPLYIFWRHVWHHFTSSGAMSGTTVESKLCKPLWWLLNCFLSFCGEYMDINVENFSEKILAIHEPDYGDFMRKANHYLLDLRRALGRLPNPEIKIKLAQMQNYIQFHPNWEVEPTLKQILKDINEIDNMMELTH